MPLCVCCLLSSGAQAAMSDSSSSGCRDSFLPQEGRPAQSGLFWSVSSQSDYIRQLLWRLDSLLLPFLHYGASMCGSSSSSWAFLPHSRPGPAGAAEAAHRPLEAPPSTDKMSLQFEMDAAAPGHATQYTPSIFSQALK